MLPSYEEDEDGKLERIDHLPFEDEQEMHDWLEKHPNTIQEDMFILMQGLLFVQEMEQTWLDMI